jgi:hypothetical protein
MEHGAQARRDFIHKIRRGQDRKAQSGRNEVADGEEAVHFQRKSQIELLSCHGFVQEAADRVGPSGQYQRKLERVLQPQLRRLAEVLAQLVRPADEVELLR